jgi:predicted GTPase
LIWLLEYDKFTDLDEKILKIIRESKVKDIIVVANKADNDDMKMEAFSLPVVANFPNFFTTSVSHNS